MQLKFDHDDLAPLVRQVVAQVVAELHQAEAAVPQDRIAFGEDESAWLLSMEQHQLLTQRKMGRLRFSRGPGGKILYQREALVEYLISREVSAEGGK